METDHLTMLRDEGARYLAVVDRGPLDAPVAACPGWDLRALAGHLVWVHRWARAVVEAGAPVERDAVGEAAADDDGLRRDAHDAFDALVATFARLDPSTPTWHVWRAEPVVGTWARRQAHELLVHRVDAELAVGIEPVVAPERAASGIDEYFDLVVPRKVGRDGAVLPEGTLHVHCTDTEGEWLVRTGADGAYELTREHAKGDAAWRGPAADILLALWGRRPAAGVGEVFGDRAFVERWLAVGGT